MALLAVLTALLVVIATKLCYDVWNRKSKLPYPPGPKPKFIIGNMRDFPKTNSAQTFVDWGREYNSGILSAGAFEFRVTVINDVKIAEDLLEKRPKIYNDRPQSPLVKLMQSDSTRNMALMPYGDEWRQLRKICHQNFHADAAKKYHEIQSGQVERFLKSVIREPERLFDHTSLLSISSTMLMMYGYAPETMKDPVIQAAEEAARLTMILFDFGGSLISILPVLSYVPAWVPGTQGKRMIKRVQQLNRIARRIPLEHVTAAMKSGTASSSLVTDFLERKATNGVLPGEEQAIKSIAWTVYGGGSLYRARS